MPKEVLGYSDINGFRTTNQYVNTQKLLEDLGLVPELEQGHTPTVGVNIEHLARMSSVQALAPEIGGQPLAVTILGISTAEGPSDFQRLLKGLGAGFISTTAIDISNGIFDKIKQTSLDQVTCLQIDAQHTGLPSESQDFTLRDHLGNCCPPAVDRAINQETWRITKRGGIAIVNITTSELLDQSPARALVPFEQLRHFVGEAFLEALQTHVYDLADLQQMFPHLNAEVFRGSILEIEPQQSFVVFGEDPEGHGEWFRSMENHLAGWANDGFQVLDIKSREGTDSHNPPLTCQRHNVLLRKM